MSKTKEGYGSCKRGCQCPKHGRRDEPKLTFRQRIRFLAEPPGSPGFGKSRSEWLASQEESQHPAAPHVSSLQAPDPEPDGGEWWDEAESREPEPRGESQVFLDMQQEM